MLIDARKLLATNTNFSLYFGGRSVSALGDSFYFVALMPALIQATHSLATSAIVLSAAAVPSIVFSLLGGLFSDRLPRNRVMLTSDLVRAASEFAMAWMLFHPNPQLVWLVLIQLCYGFGDAFFEPASVGLLPQVVSESELPIANSTIAFSMNATVVFGPALAGITMAFAGAPLALAIDGLTFLFSASALSFLKVGRLQLPRTESLLDQLRAGFREFRMRRWLIVTVAYLGLLAFAFNGPVFVIGPLVALTRLGGTSAWSLILMAFGVGLIIGSLIAPRILESRRPLAWGYIGNVGVVPMLILLGLHSSPSALIAASVVGGISVSAFSIIYPTILQQTVPDAVISQVSSYFWLVRVAPMPIALSLTAALTLRFGITSVCVGSAILILLASVLCSRIAAVWSVSNNSQSVNIT